MSTHYYIAPNLIKPTLCDNSTDSNSPGAHITIRQRMEEWKNGIGSENHPAFVTFATNETKRNDMEQYGTIWKQLQPCLQRIIWQKTYEFRNYYYEYFGRTLFATTFLCSFPFTVLTLAVKIFGCCTLLYHYYRWVFFIFDFVFSFSGKNGVSDTFALSPVYRIRQWAWRRRQNHIPNKFISCCWFSC